MLCGDKCRYVSSMFCFILTKRNNCDIFALVIKSLKANKRLSATEFDLNLHSQFNTTRRTKYTQVLL